MTPEGAIKKAICEYLSYCQDVFFWQQDSTGTFDPRTKKFRKKKSPYQRNGIPDIICLIKMNGLVCFLGLEVKSDTGRQTESQKQFELELFNFSGQNWPYAVVRDPEEAKMALDHARRAIKSRMTIKPLFGS